MQFISRLGVWLSAAASVVGLVVTLSPTSPLARLAIAIAVVFYLVVFAADVYYYWKSRPKSFKNDARIREYMCEWIGRGGRTVIFTRDMSWATVERVRSLLEAKATRDELCLCLPKPIPLSEHLRALGATVVHYAELDYVPQSRFTIINKDKMDAHVAVGRRVDGVHVIEEFSVGTHPVFAVANDLVEILQRFATRTKLKE